MSTPFRFFGVQVAGVEELTPSMRRVTFTGPDLADFADPGWDQRIKLVLPAPVGGYAYLPADGEAWYQQWLTLPAEHQPPIRTYTTRMVRSDPGADSEVPGTDRVSTGAASAGGQATGAPDDRTLVDVDMVMHASPPAQPPGPAARWLGACEVGTRAMLLGPSRAWLEEAGPGAVPAGVDFVPPRLTERFLLGGDETAAPAIARILEDLPPSTKGVAIVEMPVADDAAYLPHHPGVEVRVVAREGAPHGRLLMEAVRAEARRMCPPGEPVEVEEIDVDHELLWEVPRHAKGGAALARTSLYVWLAGEASAVRAMRRDLVAGLGVDRRTVAFMGYWRLGRAEG